MGTSLRPNGQRPTWANAQLSDFRKLSFALILALLMGVPTIGNAQTPVVVKDALKALRAARTVQAAEVVGGVAATTQSAAAMTKAMRSATATQRLRAFNPCGGGKSGECLAALLGDVQKAGVVGLEGTQIEASLLKAIESAALGKVAETTRLLEDAERLAASTGVKLPQSLTNEIGDSAFIFSSSGLKALNEGELKIFRQLAYADPVTKARIADVLGDTDALIKSVGNIGAKALEERLVWVPLASNEGLRRILLRTVLDDFATRSGALKTALRGAPESEKAWDVIFVGAGPHSASGANALTKANPNASQLVIDAENVVSANFEKGGRIFAINSSNRAQVAGDIARPGGTANINPIEGPVGVPDLSGLKYPEGRTIADASAVALSASGADVLFNTRVMGIRAAKAGSPAKYAIDIQGVTGVKTVYSNKVVISTGLGAEFTGIGDAASKRLIKSEIAKVDLANPDVVPGIVTFDQFKRLADVSKRGRDVYREAESIAVVGLGDSGRVTLEYLVGEGPKGAYEGLGTLDRAQRGTVGSIDWVVGSSGPRNATEYSAGIAGGKYPGSRPRYARLTNPIRKADLAIKNGNELGRESIRLVAGRLDKVRVVREGGKRKFALTYVFENGTEEVKVVDRVILATGFRNRTGDFVADLLPEGTELTTTIEKSGVLTRVRGIIPGSEKQVYVAKRVPKEDVFFIGPAAGDDLPSAAAKAGINENGASLFNLIPRTVALSTANLAKVSGLTPVRPVAEAVVRVSSKKGAQFVIAEASNVGPAIRLPEGYEAFASKVELSKTLDGFRFDGVKQLELTFSRQGGEIVMATNADSAALADALANNEAFLGIAKELTASNRAVTFTAQIRTSANKASGLEKGAVRFDTLQITY